jgi:hypothetical protein
MLDRLLPQPGPVRRLAYGTLVSSSGSGAWYTCWALFLVRSVGLTPAQVGIGLMVAGCVGVLAAIPLGRLADRVGPRTVLVVLTGTAALAYGSYTLVTGFAGFVVVACIAEAAVRGGGGVRAALVLGLVGPAGRMAAVASLRVTHHVGFAVGSLGGAVVLTLDTRAAYLAMIALNALTYAVNAAVVAGVPRVPGRPRAGGSPSLGVLADRPYVLLAALTGVLSLCWAMLSSGLPLWVAERTTAPPGVCGVIVLVSSLGIVAFQVRVSQGIGSPPTAARAAIASAVALAGACALIAATDGRGGVLAVSLLLVAGLLHLAGELLFMAASWGLSIPLMPTGAAGEYAGVFTAGQVAAQMAAPALMTTVVVGLGPPGWLLLGAVFLAAAGPTPAITGWALRTRPAPS